MGMNLSTMSAATAAVIGICVALGITIIALIIFIILFCRIKILNDTNIRKRILAKASAPAVAIEETKVLVPPPAPAPVPVPRPIVYVPQPVPRRQVIYQPLPPPPPPPPPPPAPQPEVVIHEVVHRYEPAPAPVPAPAPAVQQTRIVRRSSWSAPSQEPDEWVMVKKTRKRKGPRARHNRDDDSSSSDDEEEVVTTRKQAQRTGTAGVQYVMPSLQAYDLAMPTVFQARQPTMMNGAATSYVIGQRPMQFTNGTPIYMSAANGNAATTAMPMMTLNM